MTFGEGDFKTVRDLISEDKAVNTIGMAVTMAASSVFNQSGGKRDRAQCKMEDAIADFAVTSAMCRSIVEVRSQPHLCAYRMRNMCHILADVCKRTDSCEMVGFQYRFPQGREPCRPPRIATRCA